VSIRVKLAFAAFLVLAGCSGGTPRPATVSTVEATPLTQLPAPTRAEFANENRPYLIGPFDKLSVDVFGIPDLSREVQADASGRISVPLAGTVDAAGKTPAELAMLIADRLRGQYVRNPQVTVNLKETMSQIVTIDGQVREPGLYPVVGKMTLMRAIATAKGATEFAQLRDVVILRTVDGKKMAGLYDVASIRSGRYEDPEVYANDVVLVGESSRRRLFRDLLQVTPAVLTPLIYLLR
jgi:polysaccharide biosynthesis/export protein